MTDYFALLEQPQRPWIDDEKLKRAYHSKTLAAHPDASGAAASSDFAELNEGYRILRDPRLRLNHLLALHGTAANDSSIPEQLQDLFPAISSAVTHGRQVAEKMRAASSALSRGLLRAEWSRSRSDIDQLLQRLTRLNDSALDDLRALDATWCDHAEACRAEAGRLAQMFAYLDRWRTQLDELRFQLDTFI